MFGLFASHEGFLGLPEHIVADLLAAVLFGVVLVLVVGFGVKFIDKFAWKELDLEEQVQKGNVAAGIVMGMTILGAFLAVAWVVRGILG
jgi:uncharacterized membrane protein YjfL (UPF0719 family)